VGKTALAVALAHHRRVQDHFQAGVLWAGLGPRGNAVSVLTAWGLALDKDITRLKNIRDKQQAIQRAIGQRRLLLVIDDAWELETAQLLRCGGPNCVHLLTTRDKALARAFAGVAQTESVPPLDEHSAVDLLQILAPEACQADPSTARLAHAVGGLPLALELLGGYLAAPERSLFPDLSRAALAELDDPQRRLQLAETRLGAPNEKISLQETIALSLEGLRETEAGQEVVRAFYALGAFAPKPETFSREAAEAVTGSGGATLASLVARNLVEKQGEQLALHQTLADVARIGLDDTAVTRHREFYLALVNEDPEDWQCIKAAYGQIKWAWMSLPLDDVLEFVWALDVYQERQGLWADTLEWADRGLESARMDDDRKSEGTLLNNIGMAYDNLGQRDLALNYYNDALPISEEVGDQSLLATILNNIGTIHSSQGQWKQALGFYNRALPILREEGKWSVLVITLNNIGVEYSNREQWDQALDFYNRALFIAKEQDDQAGIAITLNNIGNFHRLQKELDEAFDFYNQALLIWEEVGDRPGLAATLDNIGLVYAGLEQWDKALAFYNRALPIWEEVGDQPGLAGILNNIGNFHRLQKEWDKALEFYNRALPIWEEVGDQPGLADTLNNIGLVYDSLEQWDKALEFYNRALPIWEEVGDRPGLAATLYNIGLVYNSLEEWDKALDFYNRALPIWEEVDDR
jgi:tetratricopeptide (TPR) repeat protein